MASETRGATLPCDCWCWGAARCVAVCAPNRKARSATQVALELFRLLHEARRGAITPTASARLELLARAVGEQGRGVAARDVAAATEPVPCAHELSRLARRVRVVGVVTRRRGCAVDPNGLDLGALSTAAAGPLSALRQHGPAPALAPGCDVALELLHALDYDVLVDLTSLQVGPLEAARGVV